MSKRTLKSPEFFKREFYKESRKIEILKIMKKFGGYKAYEMAENEKAIRRYFGTTKHFPIPKLLEVDDQKAVYFEYIEGISLFQLLQLLDKMVKGKNIRIQKKAWQTKYICIKRAVEDTLYFQSRNEKLSSIISNPTPYPYFDRIYNSILFASKNILHEPEVSSDIISDINVLAGNLKVKSVWHYRDASPKNMMVRSKALSMKNGYSYLKESIESNSEDWILKFISKNLYHVDFRSVSQLVTQQDDLIHMVEHEVANLGPKINMISMLPGIKKDYDWYLTLLARAIRFWGRRIAYLYKDPAIYRKRYKDENHQFHYQKILCAIENLKKFKDESREFPYLEKRIRELGERLYGQLVFRAD